MLYYIHVITKLTLIAASFKMDGQGMYRIQIEILAARGSAGGRRMELCQEHIQGRFCY